MAAQGWPADTRQRARIRRPHALARILSREWKAWQEQRIIRRYLRIVNVQKIIGVTPNTTNGRIRSFVIINTVIFIYFFFINIHNTFARSDLFDFTPDPKKQN